VAELDQVVQGGLIRHAQQTRGRFVGDLRRLELGGLTLDSAVYSQRVSGFGGLSAKGLTFGVFPAPSGSGNLNGFALKRGVWGFGQEGEIRGSIPPYLRWFSILVERPALEERMETLGLDPVRLRAIEGAPIAWPIDLARVESILHGLFDGPGIPAPDFDIEEALIASLLGRSAGPSVVPDRPRRAAWVLRRAEDHLRSVIDRPVSATELCRSVGCGRRQLETVFREHYGIGPIRFHRQLRMNLARRALQTQGAGRGEVTRVANAYGFAHLGRFAGAYRSLFGETPRATAQSDRGARR
jgi:AraC-like DNA-binding protein